jgi:hypothetical protein
MCYHVDTYTYHCPHTHKTNGTKHPKWHVTSKPKYNSLAHIGIQAQLTPSWTHNIKQENDVNSNLENGIESSTQGFISHPKVQIIIIMFTLELVLTYPSGKP